MVYHGSQSGNIDKLHVNYSYLTNTRVAYGTPNWLMALILGTGWRDDNINLGTLNKKPYLKEITEGAFNRFLTRPTYVYTLEDKHWHMHANLCLFERVTQVEQSPYAQQLIINPFDVIKQSHVHMIYYK